MIKRLAKAVGLILGLSLPCLAGPSTPPAGNYITNISTSASRQVLSVSSGTFNNITITGTCTGSGCGTGGGGGGGVGGTITASPNFNVGYYSAVSSTQTISGNSSFQFIPSSGVVASTATVNGKVVISSSLVNGDVTNLPLTIQNSHIGAGDWYTGINYLNGALGQSAYQMGYHGGNSPTGFFWANNGTIDARLSTTPLAAAGGMCTDSNLTMTTNCNSAQVTLSSVTVSSVAFNGAGNLSFTNTTNPSTYQVVGSSTNAAVASYAIFSTSWTIVPGPTPGGGGGTPAGNAFDVQMSSNNGTSFAGYDNFQNNGSTITMSSVGNFSLINVSTVAYSNTFVTVISSLPTSQIFNASQNYANMTDIEWTTAIQNTNTQASSDFNFFENTSGSVSSLADGIATYSFARDIPGANGNLQGTESRVLGQGQAPFYEAQKSLAQWIASAGTKGTSSEIVGHEFQIIIASNDTVTPISTGTVIGILEDKWTGSGAPNQSWSMYLASTQPYFIDGQIGIGTAGPTAPLTIASSTGPTNAILVSTMSTLDISPTASQQIMALSNTGVLSLSQLPSGQCVQTGSGGALTVTGSACGSGGGSTLTTSSNTWSGNNQFNSTTTFMAAVANIDTNADQFMAYFATTSFVGPGASSGVYISTAGTLDLGTTSQYSLINLSGSNGFGSVDGINFGDIKANLYRNAAGQLKTDVSQLNVGSTGIGSTGSIACNSNLACTLQGTLGATAGYNVALNGTNDVAPSGVNSGEVQINGTYSPTATGGGTFNFLGVNSTLNQTSAANQVARGIYLYPTLTKVFDYRNLETSSTIVQMSSVSVITNAYNVKINPLSYDLKSSVISSSVITAASLDIEGPPTGVAGSTNITVTTGYGLNITSGTAPASNVTTAIGLNVVQPSGATTANLALNVVGSATISGITTLSTMTVTGTQTFNNQQFVNYTYSGAGAPAGTIASASGQTINIAVTSNTVDNATFGACNINDTSSPWGGQGGHVPCVLSLIIDTPNGHISSIGVEGRGNWEGGGWQSVGVQGHATHYDYQVAQSTTWLIGLDSQVEVISTASAGAFESSGTVTGLVVRRINGSGSPQQSFSSWFMDTNPNLFDGDLAVGPFGFVPFGVSASGLIPSTSTLAGFQVSATQGAGLTGGAIIKVGGYPTAGNFGVPIVVYHVRLDTQTATLGNTTIFTPNDSSTGTYRTTFVFNDTTASGSGTVAPTMAWTDISQAETWTGSTFGLGTLGSNGQQNTFIAVRNVPIKVGYSVTGIGGASFSVDITVERLN